MNFQITKKFPSNEEYNELFESVGWGNRDNKKIDQIREYNVFAVSVYLKDKIIGMARIVGDGCYYTVYDVVVHKDFQGQGIGAILMNSIVDWYKEIEDDDTYLYLGASYNREKFYEKFGFVSRPYGHIGAGMKYDPEFKKSMTMHC